MDVEDEATWPSALREVVHREALAPTGPGPWIAELPSPDDDSEEFWRLLAGQQVRLYTPPVWSSMRWIGSGGTVCYR